MNALFQHPVGLRKSAEPVVENAVEAKQSGLEALVLPGSANTVKDLWHGFVLSSPHSQLTHGVG